MLDIKSVEILDANGFTLSHASWEEEKAPYGFQDSVEQWVGTWSGYFFKYLTDTILPQSRGKMECILHWEDGTRTGLRVTNGVVSQHETRYVLTD